MRAFVLLLRYTGLRIRDVVCLKRSALKNGKLFLRTQKTGVPVLLPLPPFVLEALEQCPAVDEKYFFWSGNGLPKSAVADWQRSFRKLLKLAGVEGHPHMMRDTFSIFPPGERRSYRIRCRPSRQYSRHRAKTLFPLGPVPPARPRSGSDEDVVRPSRTFSATVTSKSRTSIIGCSFKAVSGFWKSWFGRRGKEYSKPFPVSLSGLRGTAKSLESCYVSCGGKTWIALRITKERSMFETPYRIYRWLGSAQPRMSLRMWRSTMPVSNDQMNQSLMGSVLDIPRFE